jgi:long-chain acyl-CoA synthetase
VTVHGNDAVVPTPTVRNLADLVGAAAARAADRTALVASAGSISWGELDSQVDRMAAGLRGLGLAPGDRVGIALPNGLDFPAVLFGALRAGLVAVPANPGFTARELAHVLSDSGAKLLVGTERVVAEAARVAADLPQLERLIVAGLSPDERARTAPTLADLLALVPTPDGPAPPPRTSRGGDDLAVLIYTSGTSGKPRGAMLSHRALLANVEQVAALESLALRADDVCLLVVPMFHVYGLGPGLISLARHACTGVLVERFDPTATLALVDRHRATVILAAPPTYGLWSRVEDLAAKVGTVRLAVSGSAPLDPGAWRRWLAATGHPIVEGYGLTETAPVVTITAGSPPKPGTIGRPLPGVELRLLDVVSGQDVLEVDVEHAGSGGGRLRDQLRGFGADPVGGDDPGEIVVRGDNLFSGYWPDGSGGPDAEGWWRTGDVAYRDDDGDLVLIDRLKELILVSGFNVYPREVEDVLVAHPGVADVGVVGVPHPQTGETVKAFVVLTGDPRPTEAELRAYCGQQLARFKCPTSIEAVDALPRSPIGKVRKSELRTES